MRQLYSLQFIQYPYSREALICYPVFEGYCQSWNHGRANYKIVIFQFIISRCRA